MKNILRYIDIFAIMTFVVPFAVYMSTLAPSVTFFDSGEFITAVYSLGSAHSPGYPLFIIFAKPFTWLPFGNIAFRVNIATAVTAALACLGVYKLVLAVQTEVASEAGKGGETVLPRAAACAAGMLFAFSPRLWLQSNHDKPYPLLAFLIALALLLILKWRRSCRDGCACPGYLYISAMICGLALGAHQTILLALPMLAFLSIFQGSRVIIAGREAILAAASFLLGTSVNLHLPVRATVKPLLNWGDPSTLSRFLWHFLRKGYPVEPPKRDLYLLWHQLSAFDINREFTIVGLALLIFGCIIGIRANRDFVVGYTLALLSFLLVVIGHLNSPIDQVFLTEEFFTPLYMLTAVVIGFALGNLATEAVMPAHRIRVRQTALTIAVFLMMLLPANAMLKNYVENDQHNNYLAFDYSTNTFRTLPHGAALFTWGDSGAFPLWYMQGVEKMREDLVIPHIPHLSFRWYLDTFQEQFSGSRLLKMPTERTPLETLLNIALKEQVAKRPVFIDFSTRYSVKTAIEGFSLIQRGICYQVVKRTDGAPFLPDISVWDQYTLRGISHDRLSFWDQDSVKAVQIYAFSHQEAGNNLISRGRAKEGNDELRKAFFLSSVIKKEAARYVPDEQERSR